MIVDGIKQVAGPSFFALLVIAVSFLPVLTLEAEEGRLFKPLAYTKTLPMVIAAFLAITLDPALRLLLTNVRNFGFRPLLAEQNGQRRVCGHHPVRGQTPDKQAPDKALSSRWPAWSL